MRRLLGGIVAAGVALVGCHKAATSTPTGMPAGYERLNAAFGVRTGGMTNADGVQTIPAVEFRSNGDYAMYSFSTDCYGHFNRGQGVVFAADGTVREQLAEQATSDLAANPQYQPLADKMCAQAKAHLASLPEGESLRKTRFGPLEVVGSPGVQQLTFQGRKLMEAYGFSLERMIPLGDTDLVLVNQRAEGNGCPGGQYLFVVVKNNKDIHATDTFGTCQQAKPTVELDGGAVVVSMPEFGGEGSASFTYRDGRVSIDPNESSAEIGQLATSTDGPNETADAAAAVAESASNAADAAANEANAAAEASMQRVAVRKQAQWLAVCRPRSQRLTTPAGSQVSLSDEEAGAYCGCLQASAPDAAVEILRSQDWSGADSGSTAAQWQAAQTNCIGRLL